MKSNKKMKIITLGFIFSGSICSYVMADGHEQKITKKDVPTVIISSFEKAYPKAKALSYSKETNKGKTIYEVESKDGTAKRDISYSANGQVLEIEEEISSNNLPKNIILSLNKSYPKAQILIAEKITKGTSIKYEIEIKNGNKTKELVFDNTKQIKVKEDEKNEGKEKAEDNENDEK